MHILGLDIGSSSVKAAIVRNGKIVGRPARSAITTKFHGVRAEVNPADVLQAIQKAIHDLGSAAKHVDAIGLSVMSPAWIAMDRSGKPLTPLITHQDRRSVAIAMQIEKRVGKARHLRIAGNRPFPGGISSTTAAWFKANHPDILRRADLIGHLNTFLHRQMTGQRVIDPSNASFTGLYETVKQGSWSKELCAAAGVDQKKLPQIFASNVIAGRILKCFGLTAGTPMMAGAVDTSCAMFLTGSHAGQLLNVSGSTDVLGLCTSQPHPNEKLLTRALGIGRKWMSVATLAASGSAIQWCREQFFADYSDAKFYRLLAKLAQEKSHGGVNFDPYLAGERTSIEQKQAAFTGLTLATTRQELLQSVIDALARASGARIDLLKSLDVPIRSRVVTSGGSVHSLHAILHRDWPGKWTFAFEDEASLRGISAAAPWSLS
jgi:xylulokinase